MPHIRALLLTTCTPDDNKVLSCIRSIHAAGGAVDVGGDKFFGQAYWSRYVCRRVRLPHPKIDDAAYVEDLNRQAESHDWNVVLPLNDYTSHALIENRARLHPALGVALPEREAWEISRDKLRTAELAAHTGVATPLTFCPRGEEEAVEAAKATGYPCVVKLRSGCGAVGRRYIHNEVDLRAAFREPRPDSDPVFDFDQLLVQQWIAGDPQDFCAIFSHGELRSCYVQRKIRTWPVDGGRATVVETIENAEVREAGIALARALKWHGSFEAEFRVEHGTGRPYLLDVNGRFWAAVGLSVAAGLDFPVMYCRLALDGDVDPRFGYAKGVRFRWPVPFALLTALKSQDRLRVLRDFLAPGVNACSDLRWTDPGPLLAEHLYLLRRAWQRRSLRPGEHSWDPASWLITWRKGK